MKEIQDILSAYERAAGSNQKAALLTVVHVEGSSYRRPGARMLVLEDGSLTGSISGGCLEGDALRRAKLAMLNGRNMLITYDSMDDEDGREGLGLGCNGTIQVLIEPFHPSRNGGPLELLKGISNSRKDTVIITLFSLDNKSSLQPGTIGQLTQAASGEENNFLQDHHALKDEAVKVLTHKKSAFKSVIYKGLEYTAFLEFSAPLISLVIIGAGNDVIPLAKMAMVLGWMVNIVDDGRSRNALHRFEASCQRMITRPSDVLNHYPLDARSVFVLMTHNYHYDLSMLKALAGKDIGYLGVLGPRRKLENMILEANVLQAHPGQIHSPMGLDIGAESPEEIALSILSEVKATLAGKEGGKLRNLNAEIHHRSDFYIQPLETDTQPRS